MDKKTQIKLIGNSYKKAKKSIKIGKKDYYLYFALLRTEKNFKHLLPFDKYDSDDVKIILDNKSDICLGYGTKRVIELYRNKKERIDELLCEELANTKPVKERLNSVRKAFIK